MGFFFFFQLARNVCAFGSATGVSSATADISASRSLRETLCTWTAVHLMQLNMMRPQPPLPPRSPGCSRHLLLAVGLVGWAGGHYGLLEALHTPLHGAAHVPAHHIGTPVPEERERQGYKQELQHTRNCDKHLSGKNCADSSGLVTERFNDLGNKKHQNQVVKLYLAFPYRLRHFTEVFLHLFFFLSRLVILVYQ